MMVSSKAAKIRPGGNSRMAVMEFEVCRHGRQARWVVRLGSAIYGDYLNKEQAVLDAVDAARDALQAGREARVWLRDQATADRLL
jgi:hypothetical protein